MLLFADKAVVVRILKLPGKDAGKGLFGQLPALHVADEGIHPGFVRLCGLAKE